MASLGPGGRTEPVPERPFDTATAVKVLRRGRVKPSVWTLLNTFCRPGSRVRERVLGGSPMRISLSNSKVLSGVLICFGLLSVAQPVTAQSVRMPSTLRYGSGLLDIPVASVLPHMTIVGTYSGFTASIPEFVIVDPMGNFITVGSPYEKWLSDGSLAIGLFDRVEVGVSLQHLAAAEDGGNLIGGFGRISLLPSSVSNFDLAVGARYTNSPTFGDDYSNRYEFQPNRLGYPDSRLHTDVGDDDYNANLSPYAVATAHLPVSDGSAISLTGGWGSGVFSAGGDLDFHQDGTSGGIFAGAGIHIGMGSRRQLNLIGEYNGFDMNAGVQLDMGYIRVGAFALGMTHDGYSTFRSRKLGFMGSIALPSNKADTVITPYTVTVVDTTVTMRRVITADTTVEGRALSASDRGTLEALILFEFDEAELTETGQSQVQAKATALRNNPGVELRIEGHADEVGTEQYNVDLGMERANAVVEAMTGAGISSGRLSAMSHGESRPLTEGRSAEARSQNRRVEFNITRETTLETVITADTTMVPDTTFTERDVQMADTVITPSRWSYNTDAGAADEPEALEQDVRLAMSDMGFEPADADRVTRPNLEVPVLVASTATAARPGVALFRMEPIRRVLG